MKFNGFEISTVVATAALIQAPFKAREEDAAGVAVASVIIGSAIADRVVAEQRAPIREHAV